MRTDYPAVITESIEELTQQEQTRRGQRQQTRLRMLVLLKSGAATSLAQCGQLIGYSRRQVSRWWTGY